MYSEHFGFTNAEVKQMLADYSLTEQVEEVQQWYDGYNFGGTEVYNPWSLINYVRDADQGERTPTPYWSNTSGNSIVRSLLERVDDEVREDLELLMSEGVIEKPIHEDMTYQEIYESTDNIWNFLYFTGYLTKVQGERRGLTDFMTLRIPNDEVKYIYENQISSWTKKMVSQDLHVLYEAILTGKDAAAQEEINRILLESISFMDSPEAFYHGMMTGIFSGISARGYRMVSNRESGVGRPDLLLIPSDIQKPGMVIELKASKTADKLEDDSQAAMEQIERNKYEEELKQKGCKGIFLYGISFFRKNCVILCKEYK